MNFRLGDQWWRHRRHQSLTPRREQPGRHADPVLAARIHQIPLILVCYGQIMPSQIDDTTLRMALIGYGSAVLEELNSLGLNTPVVRIGWPNRFIEHGKLDPLHAKSGITPETAIEKLRPYLKIHQPQTV